MQIMNDAKVTETRHSSLEAKVLTPFVLGLMSILLAACSSTSTSPADSTSGPSPVALGQPPITELVGSVDLARASWSEGAEGWALVVYYSQGSATKKVAEDLALLTGGVLEAIQDARPRGTGFFSFMTMGASATFRKASPIMPPVHNPVDYEVVFVCTPVWSWNLSPPVRSWLRQAKGSLKHVSFITVSGDTEPDKIIKNMAKEAGLQPFSYAGISDADFQPDNQAIYAAKLAGLLAPLR